MDPPFSLFRFFFFVFRKQAKTFKNKASSLCLSQSTAFLCSLGSSSSDTSHAHSLPPPPPRSTMSEPMGPVDWKGLFEWSMKHQEAPRAPGDGGPKAMSEQDRKW